VSLERHKRDWEELAAEDPLWAVLTDPSRRAGGWEVAEFLRTGEEEIEQLLARARELDLPAAFGRALDFGCGAGRLTRALADRFGECVGVDISEAMVAEARRINTDCAGCTFVVNDTADLSRFPDASFDLVYSTLVLQHLPSRRLIAAYLAEFVRVVSSGGVAVFQLPSSLGLVHRLQASRRLYGGLRRLRVPERILLRRTPLTPMRMVAAPEDWVRRAVAASGGAVVAVDRLDGGSLRYWVMESPTAPGRPFRGPARTRPT
jgi:SAM-dependent methyltransferase